jgi:SnoaL-like domain
MSSAANIRPARPWSVEAFAAFWADPDPAKVPAIRAVITDDIVGYWPRPIGVVRGAAAYYKVIESVLTAGPRFTLALGEHASTGDFTFIRWIATVTEAGETVQFDGCDRVRTRGGLVCENYVFCDHPFFEKVAGRLRQIAA